MSGQLVDPKREAVALQVRSTAAIGETRQIEFVTAIALDAPPAQLDELLDKIGRAQDRQAAFYKWLMLKDKLADLVQILIRYESDLIMVGEQARLRWEGGGRHGEWTPDKLTGAEKQAKLANEQNIDKERKRGKLIQEDIAKLEAQYGFGASDIGANRGTGDSDREVHRHDLAGGAAP